MRILLAGLTASVFLTGCGLPPALTVATTVADGMTYAITGKSMTDHALSAATTEDCALIRLLDERDVCTGYAGEEAPRVLTASSPEVGGWGAIESASLAQPGAGGSVGGGTGAAGEGAVTGSAPAAQFAAAAPALKPQALTDGAVVTVVGSFRDRANAERAVRSLGALQPRIVVAQGRNGTLYRLVSDTPLQQARSAGIADAWPVRVAGTSL